MTSEQIIEVAKIVAKYLEGDINVDMFPGYEFDLTLTPKDEQNILDRYYNLYGMQEEDIRQALDKLEDDKWYEQAERIR